MSPYTHEEGTTMSTLPFILLLMVILLVWGVALWACFKAEDRTGIPVQKSTENEEEPSESQRKAA
jgi:hypothetical protein